ncbi:hypothetical protein QC589_01410 [Halomonas elongata]|uniref:hypothetical protein n=1 Tax=Halomonas elongata TaxID=2746 RepID=UPI00334B59A6
MIITLSPIRSTSRAVLEKQGDVLHINGEAFDFSSLQDGDTLPAEAIISDVIAGAVRRHGDVLTVPVLLGIGPHAPHASRYPSPLTDVPDGPVVLPPYDAEVVDDN